ncbi:unnamed protein product [Bemisia tabaci]|uniref:Uncharacterized protein n=1 Tax=Bemisia tabaci TaxID=7038 RepID=A0A9P0EW96_BEMTA|nr:unnamed protein product [Bemisia tabaci]
MSGPEGYQTRNRAERRNVNPQWRGRRRHRDQSLDVAAVGGHDMENVVQHPLEPVVHIQQGRDMPTPPHPGQVPIPNFVLMNHDNWREPRNEWRQPRNERRDLWHHVDVGIDSVSRHDLNQRCVSPTPSRCSSRSDRSGSRRSSVASSATSQTLHHILDKLDNLQVDVSRRLDSLEKQAGKTSHKPVKPFLNKVKRSSSQQTGGSNSDSSQNGSSIKIVKHVNSIRFNDLPRFNGNLDKCHPKDFVHIVTVYFNAKNADDATKVMEVGMLLEGEAKIWFQSTDFHLFEDFVDGFLKYYWGRGDQSNISGSLYANKFDPAVDKYATYFLKYVRDTKHLDEPIPIPALISAVLAHFPRDVQEQFIDDHELTTEHVQRKLQRIDQIRKQGITKALSPADSATSNSSTFKNKFGPRPLNQQRVSVIQTDTSGTSDSNFMPEAEAQLETDSLN